MATKDGKKTKTKLNKVDKAFIDAGKSEIVYRELVEQYNVEPARAQKMIYNYQSAGNSVF